MLSYERTRRFERDWEALDQAGRERFGTACERFDADLEAGEFRRGLRVMRIQGTDSIFEMTWAPDGRATFEYGSPQGKGAHVIWRRIGLHGGFRRP